MRYDTAVVSDDGKLALTGSDGRREPSLKLWDMKSGTEVRTIDGDSALLGPNNEYPASSPSRSCQATPSPSPAGSTASSSAEPARASPPFLSPLKPAQSSTSC